MPGTYRLGDGIDSFSLRIDLDVGEATASGIFVAFNPDNPFLDVRGEVEVTLSAIQPSDSIFHEVGGTVTGTALKISDDTPVSFAVNF